MFLFLQPEKAQDTDWDGLRVRWGLARWRMRRKCFGIPGESPFPRWSGRDRSPSHGLADAAARMKQVMVGYVGKNHELILREEALETGGDRRALSRRTSISSCPHAAGPIWSWESSTEYFGLLSELSCGHAGEEPP